MVYKVKMNGVDIEVSSLRELSFLGVQLSEEPNGMPAGLNVKSVINGVRFTGFRPFRASDFDTYSECVKDIYNTSGSREEIVEMVKEKYGCVITKACVSAVRTGKIGAGISA